MAATDKLDKVDLQILQALQDNARLTTRELASRVSLSSTPVFERLKRLEREGYIMKYVAVLNADKLNRGFVVFCKVKLTRLNSDVAAMFAGVVRSLTQVTECYNISGGYDYLLKVNVTDIKSYRDFILNVLGRLDYLSSIESVFVMDGIKHDYGLSLI